MAWRSGLVRDILQRDTEYAHSVYFRRRGAWYHVWCRYRDRSVDRIRDCFIVPVCYGADGSMWNDLSSTVPATAPAVW